MSDLSDLRKRILELPPKRLALLALDLQEQLERERGRRAEPIAVVGMACRFPGGSNSPAEFWELLEAGRDAIVEVPRERWDVDALFDPDPDALGKVATRFGGFVDDVRRFDAGFFAISPREARAMDPQQRLLLETCWRAFEDAAIPPARYYGKPAGVFVGICSNDYVMRLFKEGAEAIDLYLSSGNAYSVAAGRIAFTFGFQGPAFAVDTACSSSLVALHAACHSLRGGESSLAVAAGVNVMCSVETTLALSRSRVMAPDGRCKTFDDAADGFVRSEGCGVLLLKRLSDAERDGDRIHALLRGTALNQDGRSAGLTVPNGPAQEQVIREALARSGLQPDDIDYVETHGTGTSLGDPIEIRALGRVFGSHREVPLYVGSVKTNIGHLESAAGVAGMVKAILAIEHGRIPPHLHFRTPNRHIEWDKYAIEVPADGITWPATGRPRRAGVSSFGFSGTNAHVIVEQAPEPRPAPSDALSARSAELLLLSGATAGARDRLGTDFARALAVLEPAGFADFCHTARVGRTHLAWRRALVAVNAREAAEALAGSGEVAVFDSAERCGDPPGLVFLFTGQGAQHPGMGRVLYEREAVFRSAIDRCAAILDPLLELPLRSVLFDDGGDDAPIYRTTLAQPAVVAFEWALAELWRSWGVEPAAVLGHSLGEFVAATVAGVLRLEDMLPLVCERGRLLDSLPAGQRMAAVFAGEAALAPLLADFPGTYIAAYNAPENTVISGDAAAVDGLLAVCGARGIEHRVLRLERAFHSPGVEPVMDALERAAAPVGHRAPGLPIAWNVTGEAGAGGATDGGYWRRHARLPVRFTQGVRALAEQGFRHFLEVGPHPTLSPLVTQAVEDAVVVASLRRGGDAGRDLLEAAAQLYVHGVSLDWAALDAGTARRRVAVPVHPFGGERFWVDADGELRSGAPRGAVPGARLAAAVPIFETVFTPGQPAFLDQHRFRGEAVVPGPLFVELARASAAAAGYPAAEVCDLEIATAAFVPEAGLRIQTVLQERDGGVSFRVLSAPTKETSPSWTEHATGRLADGAPAPDTAPPEEGGQEEWLAVPVAGHLQAIARFGFELGEEAALYQDLEVRRGAARARLRPALPGTPAAVAAALALDAAFQVLGAALAAEQPGQARMLTGVERIDFAGSPLEAVSCTARLRAGAAGRIVRGDVALRAADGRVVATASGVTLGRVAAPGDGADAWFHRLQWRPAAAGAFEADDLVRAGEELDRRIDGLAEQASLPACMAWLPALNRRVAWHVARALVALGAPAAAPLPGPAELQTKLAIVPRHRRLLTRLLALLGEAGLLRDGPEGQVLAADPPEPAVPAPPPGCEPVLALTERCAAQLPAVLRGELDPLVLLFPRGGADATRAIYRDTPFGRCFNDAAAALVSSLVAGRDPASPLRVLEVGAGSGSTAEAVLGALGERAVEYVFTDVSPTLVAAAESALGGRSGLVFGTLDIEREPAAQGFVAASFDLVLAANVLHATADLAASVRRAASLLRPGGALLLLEGTRPEPWVDVTFGLTEGWWRFSDAGLRPDYPLLAPERWAGVARAAGLVDVAALPSGGRAENAGQVLLLARAADSAAVAISDATVIDARRDPDAKVLLAELRRAARDLEPRPVWVVTENAQSVLPGDRPDPDAAVLWGLGRTFGLEHPDRWGGLIDLQVGTPDDVARGQIEAALRDPAEDQVAFRGGVRLRARLAACAAPPATPMAVAGGTCLVTGGLGGLGLQVARWLAEAGARRTVLVGRNASPDSWPGDDPRHEALRALRATGIDVQLRAVDVTDHDAVTALVRELLDDAEVPLRGIVHAAAVFDATPITDLTPERLEAVLAPKATGARVLAELTADASLDFFVLFSSTTSLLGVGGLGAYAAANQYLDALAARLRADGRPVLVVNWGLWQEMRLAAEADATRYAQAGLLPMGTDAALEALGRVLGSGAAAAIVANVDWWRLRSVYEARRARPLLAELGTRAADQPASPAPAQHLAGLVALPPARRKERILEAVEDAVRSVLRLARDARLDSDQGFFEMGMDSLMSVELKGRLERRFGEKLPATLTFNYPSVSAVGEYLDERFAAKAAAATAPGETGAAAAAAAPAAAPAPSQADAEPELSEEELTRLLGDRLARLEREGQAP